MATTEQIEQAKYLINRYDSFFQVVDIKGNILSAYHFFIIGGIILNYDNLLRLLDLGKDGHVIFFWLVLLLVVSSLISVFFIFRAIHPFLDSYKKQSRKKKDGADKSLIFFKSISEMDQESFDERFSEQSLKQMAEDYRGQTYILARGLTQKIHLVRIAGLICYFHLLIAVIIIFIKLL